MDNIDFRSSSFGTVHIQHSSLTCTNLTKPAIIFCSEGNLFHAPVVGRNRSRNNNLAPWRKALASFSNFLSRFFSHIFKILSNYSIWDYFRFYPSVIRKYLFLAHCLPILAKRVSAKWYRRKKKWTSPWRRLRDQTCK